MKKRRNLGNKIKTVTTQPSKEHVDYLGKMTLFWLSITVAGIFVALLVLNYRDNFSAFLNNNRTACLIYAAIYVAWKIYRVKSRLALVNLPDFREKMKSDFLFAKHFNNSEIIKTLVSYFLFSIPFLYATGFAQDTLGIIGYKSEGFGLDLRNLFVSTLSSVFALAFGIAGSYIYDKIKHKLP